ncbi:MAG: 30S ribosome-binding factor RbfA [Gemmatimonadaceae bacterium]|jgi:ribosome-binding factor A
MPRDNRRAERVSAAIREEIASYLTSGSRDSRIAGMVTVTGVDVTSDLRRARVYVSVMDSDGTDPVAILNQVGHRLRGEIGRALRLRLAPELDFQIDETAAKASRIESLLAQIKAEDSSRER